MGRARPADERFLEKFTKSADAVCWLWEGTVSGRYGVFWGGPGVGPVLAHRFAYELFVGPIPTGLVIDHLCENRLCVNPAHLEPVLNGHNLVRSAFQATHCRHGHLWNETNTVWRIDKTNGPVRLCRACRDERMRRFRVNHPGYDGMWKRAHLTSREATLEDQTDPRTSQPNGGG